MWPGSFLSGQNGPSSFSATSLENNYIILWSCTFHSIESMLFILYSTITLRIPPRNRYLFRIFCLGMGAVTACRMLVSHNWYDCSKPADMDDRDKSHKSLKCCQFALWKFQRGMWVLVGGSEPRMAIWTIEWSHPINSLKTVASQLEAISAETIDKSKTLHSYCPLRE